MMIAAMMLMTVGAFAQAGKMGVGANLYYGLATNYKQLGLGAKFQYEFIENFRAEAEGAYFLKKDDCNMYTVNLNFHYLIPVAEDIKVYPIAGLGVLGVKYNYSSEVKDAYKALYGEEISDGTSCFAWNLGAGAEYQLSDNLKLDLGVRYQCGKKDGVKNDWEIINLGIVYQF